MKSNAQELPNVSGGDALGSGGTSSYSIGQLAFTTNDGITGSVAQGVQQAYELSTNTGQEETSINLSFSTFPNPTTNFLILQVDALESPSLIYQLYDLNGKLLHQQEITNTQTCIPMESLSVSSYFLKVIQNNVIVKSFRIVKTK